MNSSNPKKLSKRDLMMIADMRGVKVKKKHQRKMELFRILKKNVKKHTMNHHLNQ